MRRSISIGTAAVYDDLLPAAVGQPELPAQLCAPVMGIEASACAAQTGLQRKEYRVARTFLHTGRAPPAVAPVAYDRLPCLQHEQIARTDIAAASAADTLGGFNPYAHLSDISFLLFISLPLWEPTFNFSAAGRRSLSRRPASAVSSRTSHRPGRGRDSRGSRQSCASASPAGPPDER